MQVERVIKRRKSRSKNLTDNGKICSKCGVEKPLTEYRTIISKRNPVGYLSARCIDCHKEYQRNYIRKVCKTEEYKEKYKRYLNKDDVRERRKNKYAKEYISNKTYCSIYYGSCIVCGRIFVSKKKKKFCSIKCNSSYGYNKSKDTGKNIVYNKRAKEKHWSLRNPYITCIVCGKSYDRRSGGSRTCCSIECSKINRNYKNGNKRRAERYGAYHEPLDALKVMHRDKWTCQICGKKLSKSKRGMIDDDAPELDHIIPLSKGGPHTYSNVQCLCRKCNNVKSNKIYNDQQLNIAI